MTKIQGKKHIILWTVFVIYCASMIWLLFGRTQFNVGKSYWEQVKMNVNLIPFNTISQYAYLLIEKTNVHLLPHAFINLFGNVVVFIPLGIFLPFLCEKLQSFKWLLLCSIAIILMVELIQLFTLMGSFDIDDLILNLFGIMIGFLLLRLLTLLCSKINR